MAAQKTARASPELRKGSTQPALPSDLHHNPGHKPGSKARLVLLLALNTGMSRQDLCLSGSHMLSIRNGTLRFSYQRGKTDVPATIPVLPELAEELQRLPEGQSLFITKNGTEDAYRVESLGNWFRKRCQDAGVPGSLHGLRKAGATRLADAGASEWEIASYLAHTDTTQAAVYTRKANRSRLADSGFKKLSDVSNTYKELDNER